MNIYEKYENLKSYSIINTGSKYWEDRQLQCFHLPSIAFTASFKLETKEHFKLKNKTQQIDFNIQKQLSLSSNIKPLDLQVIITSLIHENNKHFEFFFAGNVTYDHHVFL